MNTQLDVVLKKEMTRKEFMATLGFGAVSLMGFGSIIKFIRGHDTSKANKASGGYGSSSYGK